MTNLKLDPAVLVSRIERIAFVSNGIQHTFAPSEYMKVFPTLFAKNDSPQEMIRKKATVMHDLFELAASRKLLPMVDTQVCEWMSYVARLATATANGFRQAMLPVVQVANYGMNTRAIRESTDKLQKCIQKGPLVAGQTENTTELDIADETLRQRFVDAVTASFGAMLELETFGSALSKPEHARFISGLYVLTALPFSVGTEMNCFSLDFWMLTAVHHGIRRCNTSLVTNSMLTLSRTASVDTGTASVKTPRIEHVLASWHKTVCQNASVVWVGVHTKVTKAIRKLGNNSAPFITVPGYIKSVSVTNMLVTEMNRQKRKRASPDSSATKGPENAEETKGPDNVEATKGPDGASPSSLGPDNVEATKDPETKVTPEMKTRAALVRTSTYSKLVDTEYWIFIHNSHETLMEDMRQRFKNKYPDWACKIPAMMAQAATWCKSREENVDYGHFVDEKVFTMHSSSSNKEMYMTDDTTPLPVLCYTTFNVHTPRGHNYISYEDAFGKSGRSGIYGRKDSHKARLEDQTELLGIMKDAATVLRAEVGKVVSLGSAFIRASK